MKVVRVDQLKPGDVTAATVKNEAGGVLIGPGTTLSDATIRRLKAAGVDTVSVETRGDDTPKNMSNIVRRLEELSVRFAGVTDPLLLEIKDVTAKRLQAMLEPTTAKEN